MTYLEFRDKIRARLEITPDGLEWKQLREKLNLPSKHACPEWTKSLEKDIGLVRVKGTGRALVWKIERVRKSRV